VSHFPIPRITAAPAAGSEGNPPKTSNSDPKTQPDLAIVLAMIMVRETQVESMPENEFDIRKGDDSMAASIKWLDDLAKAQETARRVQKPIFLDFFNPH
jgi:hypothetical protein